MRYLEERGIGSNSAVRRPDLPAAILFDLRVGDREFVQPPNAVSRRQGRRPKVRSLKEMSVPALVRRWQDGRT